MKFFIFSILSIVLLSFCLFESEAKQKKKVKYCHLNHLILTCVNQFRAFSAIVNGTGIVTNEHQMDQFCGSVNY